MRKSVLLSSVKYGNMEFLVQYYNDYLSKDYSSKIRLYYANHTKAYSSNKLLHYTMRIFEMAKQYDLVIADYPSRILLRGKKVIYMSHGYGTKMTPGLDELSKPYMMKTYRMLRNRVDFVITMSDRDEKYYLKSKELAAEPLPRYVPLGLPRNDVLFDQNYIRECTKLIKKRYNAINKKIILYAPTWRGYKTSKRFPLTQDDFKKLNDFLGGRNWVLLYRPHYLEDILAGIDLTYMDNIVRVDLSEEQDPQKMLVATDMLITDYSSIYVDYLALNRPIAFIPYDLEQYNDYRGIVIDFDNLDETPGPKLMNIQELINYIEDIDSDVDNYSLSRKNAINLFYKYYDGNSCERIWNFIIRLLGC